MSLLEITGLSHGFGDKTIYRDAALSLFKGEHVGVVGPNGAGKSTLLKFCSGEMIPDKGEVLWQPGIQIGCLDQHAQVDSAQGLRQFLRTAFADLYALEEEMQQAYMASAADASLLEKAAALQNTLEARDFYSAEVRVEQVANGLGLNAVGLEKKLGELSGGQRAKAILAKLLLQEPEVLLLDEPTNFLDKEHVRWLADYLSASEKAFLAVSHNFDFLERISTHICDVEHGEIHKYTGRYSVFMKQKQQRREDYIRRYQTQQREIEKTEAYIRKNIAGVNSKNAKGRRKQLENLERIAPPEQSEVRAAFHFPVLPCSQEEQVKAEHLLIGYYYPILPELNFSVKGGQKVVITGFNGVGKSTLLKTLIRELPSLGGKVQQAETAKISYFAQDFVWANPGETPFEVLTGAFPSLGTKEARKQLFRCGISVKQAIQAVGTLSGGEQAKLKLCLLTQSPSNFLILDEPTNHLDQIAKDALMAALQEFPGTVLLVSHEERFYRDWAEKVIRI